MTANYFLKSKEPNTLTIPVEWLEEYASLILLIAAKKAKTRCEKKSQYGTGKRWSEVKDEEIDLFDYEIRYSVDKNSILNCLKE